MKIIRRLEKLEKKAVLQKPITLEDLVAASFENAEAMRIVDVAEARVDSRLIRLIQECSNIGKMPEAETGY